MEITKEPKTIAAIAVAGLVILLLILGLTLGLSRTFFIIAGIDLAAILAVFILLLIRFALHDHGRALHPRLSLMRRTSLELRLEYSHLRKAAGLPAKFRYEALQAATDGFSTLIGRGSSASVFRGILDDGTAVAVKRVEGREEHAAREFRSEVAAIARVHHINLARLLGYCLVGGGGPRFLVYEFAPNSSLNKWIFTGDEHRGCLPWRLRCSVVAGVARALAHLHDDGRRAKVLHLDVKPENVLLDEGFGAVVADFGLSKLLGREESRVWTTVRGTRGYLAPEWLLESGVSEKCDVFSYGMVLLEAVAGRRGVAMVDGRWSLLPRVAMEMVREGRAMELVDGRLIGEADETEVRRMVFVALWCLQEKSHMRPCMARVVEMVEGRLEVEPPPASEILLLDLVVDDDSVVAVGACDGFGLPEMVVSSGQPAASVDYSVAMSSLSGR